MSDMRESNPNDLLKESLRALEEETREAKQRALVERFSADGSTSHRSSLSDVQKAENPYAERRAVEKKILFMEKLTGRKFTLPQSRSVAAFIFMPQFNLTFRHAAHIYPIFMRAIAMLFVQCGLLPEGYAALRYGEKGVNKIRFKQMMGDAWFSLRTRSGVSLQQYGMFSLVALMVITLAATLCTFFARGFLNVGTASAQLFFTHPTNPYGAGPGVTDLTAVANIAAPAGGTLFDSRVTNANISVDYGLMVLDKIVRQAAADTPTGGALQNALAAMMGTYNTGVTIVGSVILLWMIVSIVLDTAKAGVFGGGRHNMVWAPIRIMFAVSLLIPMGTGFLSGQYAVMKLAEWGSNFGTRAWREYVNGVLNTDNLLTPFITNSATSLVKSISKVVTCQVVYNTHLNQSQGGLPANHRINVITDADPNNYLVTHRYTNKTGGNICGTIQYGTDATTDDMDRLLQAGAYANTTRTTAATPPAANAQDFVAPVTAASFREAARQFRLAMRGALQTTLDDTAAGAIGTGGAAIEMGRRFACAFASHHMSDGSAPGPHPVSQIPSCDTTVATNVTPYENFTEQRNMHAELKRAIMDQYNNVAKPVLVNYINTNMKNNMTARGWAGMGMWLQEISAMNGLIKAAKAPIAIVEPGAAWTPDGNAILGMNWLRCAVNFMSFRPCRISGIEEKTLESLESFDGWWEKTGGDSILNPQGTVQNADADMNIESGGRLSELLKWIGNMAAGDNGLATVLFRFFFGSNDSVFLFRAVDVAATGVYPLSQLADTGHSVLGFGVMLWGTVTLVQTVSTLKGFGFSLGMGVALGALTNLVATIGSTMIMAGLMMAFYLPVLPLLRVAFSVMTWMIAVYEAIIMVPIAALAHLVSDKDGLTAGNSQLRTAWMLWLNVLMRPVLTVMGFVGGLIIYNTFAVYFHTSFSQGAASVMADMNPISGLLARVAYSVIYLATLYSAANTCFKLMDVFPEHMMRWLGGSPDQTFRDIINKSDNSEAMMLRGAQTIKTLEQSISQGIQGSAKQKIKSRMERIKNANNPNYQMSLAQRRQMEQDRAQAMGNMSGKEREQFNNLSPRDQDAFLAKKWYNDRASFTSRSHRNEDGSYGTFGSVGFSGFGGFTDKL